MPCRLPAPLDQNDKQVKHRSMQSHAPFDLLQWLSDASASAFVAAAHKLVVPAGQTIYAQSDDGDELFRVVSGSIRLSVADQDGRELSYYLFGPGDCFGTASVVDYGPRPQTAEAFQAVELQVLNRQTINRLRTEHPNLNDALLRLLSGHMRLLSDYFASATFDEVSFRLAQRLVIVADTFGVPSEDGVTLSARLSQSELAALIGTARQTVNRILQNFQQKGWVSMRGGALVLTDLEQLRALAKKGSHLQEFID